MPALRRAKPPAPGTYDEVVSTALDRQLERLRATHAAELESVGKDARGVTQAFRYLGPVRPQSARGERPITIEWALSTPLLPSWIRKWSIAS